MIEAELPDGTVLEFPDGTAPEVVQRAVKSHLGVKAESNPSGGILQSLAQNVGNVGAGLVRGAGSIGATILAPYDMAKDAIDGKGLSLESNRARRDGMDAGLQTMGAETDSYGYKGGKLVGEVAGTAGAGGVLANGLRSIPIAAKYASPVIDAVSSSGMTAGGLTGVKAVAARAAGAGVAGGAQSAMVDPRDAVTGALISAATPGVLQLAGKFGSTVYNAVKSAKPNAGKLLAEAMGVSEAELPTIIKALNSAPDSIVPGSKFTVAQALENQGKNTAGSKMLERVVSGGPGGDALLNRYADQGAARIEALKGQGAEVYQGAANDLSNRTGNKLASILRTQAADDRLAAQVAWKGEDGLGGVYGRALQDGVNLNLPLEAMQSAMSPLGRGSVIQGADARRVLGVANDIGTIELPSVAPLAQNAARNSQSLEQAVRAAGGIRGTSGELRDLGIRESGTTGLINNKSGKSLDILAEEMHRRGFLPDSDPDTLVNAIRNKGGRNTFASDAVDGNGMQRGLEAAMGDAPAAERVPVPVPFAEFQRLRRDSGELGKRLADKGSTTEAGVLNDFNRLLTQRADDAANGITMTGDNVSPEFLGLYNKARDMTKSNADKYKGGSNIAQILRKPQGQDYTIGGDEVTNKIWHGGAGLSDDVLRLKQVLNSDSREPAMDALRKFILTDAANKTTASGNLGAALPKYVENRMFALEDVLNPDQLKTLSSVANDIRLSESAASVPGLRGSDTHAKISRALDAGLLDSSIAKSMGKLLTFKGIGADQVRNKLAEAVMNYKGKTIADLMADPKAAAKALENAEFVKSLDGPELKILREVVSRSVPVLASQ